MTRDTGFVIRMEFTVLKVHISICKFVKVVGMTSIIRVFGVKSGN